MSLPEMVRSVWFALALALGGAVPAAADLSALPRLCVDALPGEALSVDLGRADFRFAQEDDGKEKANARAARGLWRSALQTRSDPLPHAYLGMDLADEARRERNPDRRKALLEAGEFHLAAALGMTPWGRDGLAERVAPQERRQVTEGRSGRDGLRLDRLPSDEREMVRDRSWEYLVGARLALLGFARDGADRETRFAEVRRLFADGIDELPAREDERRILAVVSMPWDAPDAPRPGDLVWQRLLVEAAWLGETDYLFRKLAEAMPAEPWPPGWDEINVQTGLQWLSCALYPEWKALRGAPAPAAAGRRHCLERARACFLQVAPEAYGGQWAVFGALTADLALGADTEGDGGPFLREAARLAALLPQYTTYDDGFPVFLYDLAMSGDRGVRAVLDGEPWFHACQAAGLIRAEAAIRQSASPSSVQEETAAPESAAWTRVLAPDGQTARLVTHGESGLWLLYLQWLRGMGPWTRSDGDNGPLPRNERLAAARIACLAKNEPLGWWVWWSASDSRPREGEESDAWLEANAARCPAFAAFVGANESRRDYYRSSGRPRVERRAILVRALEQYERAAALPHPGLADMLLKGEWGLALLEGDERDVGLEDWRRVLDLCLDAHRSFTALRVAHGGREETDRREPLLGELLAVSAEERIADMAESSPWQPGAEKAMEALMRAPGEALSDGLLRTAREVYGYAGAEAPPLDRDTRLADKLVEMTWYSLEEARKARLLDKAADLYSAALNAGDRSVRLRLGDALRERVALMTGSGAGDEGARSGLESALACYEAVLGEKAASGRAHEGKALVLLEQCARGFRGGPDAGTGRSDGVAAALAEARAHYVLAAGLPPEGARTVDVWSKTLRRVADKTNGPGGDILRSEADALALKRMGGHL